MKNFKLYLIGLALIISGLNFGGCVFVDAPVVVDDSISKDTLTRMVIYNRTDSAVTVYITLGDVPNSLIDISKIPFVTDSLSPMQGSFVLAAGDSTIAYAPDTTGYVGVISFGGAPVNCPTETFPNGMNIFEFAINNDTTIPNAQESIDISCVAGVSAIIRIDIQTTNQPFNAGPTEDTVITFANTLDKNQIGLVGVYPYGCDGCTVSQAPPSCIRLPQPVQTQAICQVQRPVAQKGGIIKVNYLGTMQPAK